MVISIHNAMLLGLAFTTAQIYGIAVDFSQADSPRAVSPANIDYGFYEDPASIQPRSLANRQLSRSSTAMKTRNQGPGAVEGPNLVTAIGGFDTDCKSLQSARGPFQSISASTGVGHDELAGQPMIASLTLTNSHGRTTTWGAGNITTHGGTFNFSAGEVVTGGKIETINSGNTPSKFSLQTSKGRNYSSAPLATTNPQVNVPTGSGIISAIRACIDSYGNINSLEFDMLEKASPCTTDDECSLNGVCTQGACVCDAGWRSDDCSQLDLRPAVRLTGYNLTGDGTSAWGSKIVQDPSNKKLFHLFAAEFANGCGLDFWSPNSRIVRATSTTGPEGPYKFASEVVGTFAHNPTVIYSPADKLYLLYSIGCSAVVSSTCEKATNLTCGTGNNLNGESGVSLRTSPDLINWSSGSIAFNGDSSGAWDEDVTNPSPFALYTKEDPTPTILLAYRGCGLNCNNFPEQISIANASSYNATYSHGKQPVFKNENEDPFIWRDRRGYFHMLMHSVEAGGGFGEGPKVGRHAYARTVDGKWTFNSKTLAYDTTVEFTDGTSLEYFRRERPQLYFSDDGFMTPLYLTNGVQEQNKQSSYSLVQPIGDGAAAYKKSLGF